MKAEESAEVANARGEVALIVGTLVASSRQHPQIRKDMQVPDTKMSVLLGEFAI